MYNENEIGKNLKKYRQILGLNAYNFAVAVDLDFTYLSKIENGTAIPTIKTLVKIMNTLNISFKEFFGNEITSKQLYLDMIYKNLLNLTHNDLVYILEISDIFHLLVKRLNNELQS